MQKNPDLNSVHPKSKVCIILPSFAVGGAEKVVMQLANHLNFRICLIVLNSSGDLNRYVSSGIDVHCLNKKHLHHCFPEILKLIKRLQPNVIFSTNSHINVAILCLKLFLPRNIKFIIRESNVPSINLNFGMKGKFIKLLYNFVYKYADAIICPGNGIKNDLEKNFSVNRSRIYVIPNPINYGEITGKLSEFKIERPKNLHALIASGSLTKQKGFDLLIKAMSLLVTKMNNVHLTILGAGREMKNLRNLITNERLENAIDLHGYENNVYPFFSAADLFILSSRWEGMPNVVLESLACGTPVVAFNCPGCIEEIIDTEKQGRLVPAGDISRLANTIEEMLKQKMRDKGQSLLPIRFDIQSVASRYNDLFEKVIATI